MIRRLKISKEETHSEHHSSQFICFSSQSTMQQLCGSSVHRESSLKKTWTKKQTVVNRKSWWTEIVSQTKSIALQRLFSGAGHKMAATRSWVQLSTPYTNYELWLTQMAPIISNFEAIKHCNVCVCVCVLCYAIQKLLLLSFATHFKTFSNQWEIRFTYIFIYIAKTFQTTPVLDIYGQESYDFIQGNLECTGVILCLVFCNLYAFHRVFLFSV
jgi:hypothetical protein